jgi:hypothetical protein
LKDIWGTILKINIFQKTLTDFPHPLINWLSFFSFSFGKMFFKCLGLMWRILNQASVSVEDF